jgi:hypothetical protein
MGLGKLGKPLGRFGGKGKAHRRATEVIGRGMSEELGGDDIKRLMAGGAEIGDLRDELGV